jgi:hypothetical protein
MGYIEIFSADENGAGWKNLDQISFADKVELELALSTPNAVQVACVVCYTVIPNGTGNKCQTHKETL